MDTTPPADAALRTRVLRALAANRKARISFPGVFMELAGKKVSDGEVRLEFDDGPWCRDGAGDINLAAFSILIDTALGAVTRLSAGPSVRPATVHIEVQFTGVPLRDHLVMNASLLGHPVGTAVRQALSRGTIMSGGVAAAHAAGAFVIVDLPSGATQSAMPWPTGGLASEEIPARESLEDHERQVMDSVERAEAAASAALPFIEHFWCGIPAVEAGKAALAVPVTPHLGNRVGQVHGGILLGLATRVAAAALPAKRLSNVSAWFVSPGQGAALEVRSTVVHDGRNLAVVLTQILSAAGALVLEATSQHVAPLAHSSKHT
jgi:acyl-coenzyme A thioesterase PaaI-like protein